jgi:hypothetical protein
MPLTKVQSGLIEATGTPGATTFLRGDGSWAGTITSGTAVSASGTSVDFTGIPSTAKRITVMFSGVSTNGTSIIQVQLGDSGGVETTGYVGGYASNGVSGGKCYSLTAHSVQPHSVLLLHGHGKLRSVKRQKYLTA